MAIVETIDARCSIRSAAALAKPAPNRSLRLRVAQPVKDAVKAAENYSKLHDRFQFDDRRKGSSILIAMLAGYKPDLWDFVMPSFAASLPDGDVCLVSPGMRSEALEALCQQKNWSYLTTSINDVSLAQNVCYRLHPQAAMIVKVDEDMLLLPETIATLLDEYQKIEQQGIMRPGFLAPMIPLNGFCYRYVLEEMGCLGRFEERFGKARIGTSGLPIHTDPGIGRWIWEHTAPLAETAVRIRAKGIVRMGCPIQFSIGLIVFERRFWQAIGFLDVNRRRILMGINTLGSDEAFLCAQAVSEARPAIITNATLAGHFSFGPQFNALKGLLSDQPELFRT